MFAQLQERGVTFFQGLLIAQSPFWMASLGVAQRRSQIWQSFPSSWHGCTMSDSLGIRETKCWRSFNYVAPVLYIFRWATCRDSTWMSLNIPTIVSILTSHARKGSSPAPSRWYFLASSKTPTSSSLKYFRRSTHRVKYSTLLSISWK